MGRQTKPAYDPVKSLLTGETQTPAFREMVDNHSPILMDLIRFSMRYHERTKRDIAKGLGFSERHIGRILDGEITNKTDDYYRLVYKIVKSVRLVEFLQSLYDKDRIRFIQEEILSTIIHSQKIVEADYFQRRNKQEYSE